MSKEEINQLAEELELIKKKLRISEQDVFRLAAEKIDLQDTIKELLNQNEEVLYSQLLEALISASKWGSWAYDLKERDRQGKTKLEDFKKWRREIMEDIYNDYIKQNKDEYK